MDQRPEEVVAEVAESDGDSTEVLEASVDGLDGAGVGAHVEVGQNFADAAYVETANGVHTVTPQELVRAGVSPKRVYRRWREVLGHHEPDPSTGMRAEAIETVGGTELAGHERHLDPAGEQPPLTPIDRWGHTPLAATPLTARAIAAIVRMHLDGRAPA